MKTVLKKMFKRIIICIIIGFMTFTALDCTSQKKLKISDHCDGKKFFNTTLEKQFSPSLNDIFRMMKEGRPKWPDDVTTLGTPVLNKKLNKNDFSITFVNHATFLIQTSELNILTDPVWSNRVSPLSWFGPKRIRKPGIEINELPRIDIILISHNHYDHMDLETLKKLNSKFSPLVIVPIGDRPLIESIGISNVKELDWWESLKINQNAKVTFTPSQHSSARGLFDKDESLWGSFFIQFDNRGIYFGGDSGYSTHFKEIKKRICPPDVAILGIGAYAPSYFMEKVHMNPDEAVSAHKDLNAGLSIAMHHGTFQLASEGYEQPLTDLKKALLRENISNDIFISLLEGQTKFF
ncbi:MBL fold metallo-hydrolase [Flavobacterium sp. L1I52]|uniref:MBL fold metallo-hydrolase n=1 Tax=Flavobacterium pokkalii TaxID=1940408 RepID=A0ABR7USG4_9FLAO|nr:MBL fold metallo-hydrolase [Flavobacterium pokkalii]MBD0725850.1 MBL fold metallo-hydrolase [Flavobacterium pokkalii]